MGPLALVKLGLADEDDMKLVVTAPAGPAADDDPEAEPPSEDLPEPESQGEPDTRDDTPPAAPPGPPVREAASADLAVVAACDGLVYRAMEKAGARLRQALRRAPGGPPDCSSSVAHTVCNAAQVKPLDQLLNGVWDRLPEVAAMLDLPAAGLQRQLDDYVRGLIRSRRAHSWELLAGFLAGGDRQSRLADAVAAVDTEAAA